MTLESTLQVPVLLKRQLQAEVIGPIYAEMVKQLGEERASRRFLMLPFGMRLFPRERPLPPRPEGGKPSMADFVKLYELWTNNGSLEIEVLEQSDTRFDFNVTRCRYAETYKAMGLGKIGHLLSCNRDAGFCQGYDPDMKLERAQTIMAGATTCTFRYSREV